MSARFWFVALSASGHVALAALLLGQGDSKPSRCGKEVITLMFAPSLKKKDPIAVVPPKLSSKKAAALPKKAAVVSPVAFDSSAESEQLLLADTTASKAEGGDSRAGALRPRLLNGDEVHIPYPPKARHLKVEGSVHLMLTIAESGEVKKVIVISGPAFGLRQAAMSLARKLRFSPALDAHGNAVVSEIRHEVIFKLKEKG